MRTLLVAFTLCGCTAARLTSAPLPPPPDSRGPVVVVIEPFFEQSGWKVTQHTDYTNNYGPYSSPYGMGMSPYGSSYGSPGYYGSPGAYGQPVTVVDKPAATRVSALKSEQEIVIREIQRLRPNWQVLSTVGLQTFSGPVDLVRVVVGDTQTLDTDRTLKNFACGLGLGIPSFFMMIHETQRIQGGMMRYQSDAETLRPHLLRYPSQPDFAVDTRGLSPNQQTFGLDVAYEEGMFGPESARDQLVVTSFAQRLSVAIVALVEGIKPPEVKPPEVKPQ